jgi:hypothetical protein
MKNQWPKPRVGWRRIPPVMWMVIALLAAAVVLTGLTSCQRRICLPVACAKTYILEDGRTVVIWIVEEASDAQEPYMIHTIDPKDFE